MSEMDWLFVAFILMMTHIGFFIAGFSAAVKQVNKEVNGG